ncbi:protein ANKUB1 [Gracilinanus agilis]|uniref:protein ANKUB1 n=1 Tax=Gracilinanus agilis TaxID=191870 RepID=UPI001CFDB4E8|nr:protein ANKUB1 [Gracilinanus agilis]
MKPRTSRCNKMRIFISFEGTYEPFDVWRDDTVETVKLMIKNHFHIPLTEDKQGKSYLQLMYAGAELNDNWNLADIGVSAGSNLKCLVKKEKNPILHIFNAVTQETMPIMGSIYLLGKKVAHLKTLITLRCGFPVSIFCLRTPRGREMYDCNTLLDYQTDIGTTLRLDVWDEWKEFLIGCLKGQTRTVKRYLSEEESVLRYQKRVALYLAAFYGYVELTEWTLRQGAKPNEAVGVHPYREWCHESHHPDIIKCPIHAAAETGQLLILKAFINYNVMCLVCKNAVGQIPLTIALKNRHKDCVLYLVSKMWSTISYSKISVPMRIYIKIKQWLLRTQHRILQRTGQIGTQAFRTRVGDFVMVDGFTQPKMTSKEWSKSRKKDIKSKVSKSKVSKLPSVHEKIPIKKTVHPSTVPQQQKRIESVKLPPIEQIKEFSSLQEFPSSNPEKKITTYRKKGIMTKNRYSDQIPLPLLALKNYTHPPFCYKTPKAACFLSSSLQSFLEHSGKTTRENAVHCLATASAFKEKPWLQQLEIAKTMAKKSIYNLTTEDLTSKGRSSGGFSLRSENPNSMAAYGRSRKPRFRKSEASQHWRSGAGLRPRSKRNHHSERTRRSRIGPRWTWQTEAFPDKQARIRCQLPPLLQPGISP